MIGLFDALVLAHTKMKVNRVRTWVAVSISGLLFGVLISVVVISQGVFNSVDSFSEEGFGKRYFVAANRSSTELVNVEEELSRGSFISEVEKSYSQGIASRQQEARVLGLSYDPSRDDPSPVVIDETSKKKKIEYSSIDHWSVEPILSEIIKIKEASSAVSADSATEGYNVKSILAQERVLSPSTGSIEFMKDGKEAIAELSDEDLRLQKSGYGYYQDSENFLSVVDGTLAQPFIQSDSFDYSKGEIPVILTLGKAESLIGLDSLPSGSSASAKMERIKEVRSRISEATAMFCYRNYSSQSLLSQAVSINSEIAKNKDKQDYTQPKLVYNLPASDSCGPVTIKSDNRTAEEKSINEAQLAFDKKFNGYTDPIQYKIAVRAVGVVPGYDLTGSMSGVSGLISAMFGSSLGSSNWIIPSNMLEKVPAQHKPSETFDYEEGMSYGGYSKPTSFVAEFYNDNEARRFMNDIQCTDDCADGGFWAYPFGSSSMTVAEIKRILNSVLFWTVIVVSVIAMFILAGTVGRTIAEGRRETAIFRAIGARRFDISAIYSLYTLMLALRIVIFASIVAVVIAMSVQVWLGAEATVGSQLAFGINDYSKQFSFLGFNNLYILIILCSVVLSCLLAMALPLTRNIRRNPIRDMRDDN